MMKEIIRGGRCYDGDHNNQPFDDDDATTSTTTEDIEDNDDFNRTKQLTKLGNISTT